MKKILGLSFTLLSSILGNACPVCEKQQPKLLQGISHGAGPQSNWDFIIIGSVAVVVICTLFFSIKWLIRPGEKNNDHIKYFILNQQ